MFTKLIISLFSLLIVTSVYGASDSSQISALMGTLKTKIENSGKLQGTLDGFTQANEQLMKENKVLDDNRKIQQVNLEAQTTAYEQQIATEQKRKQAEIDKVVAEWDGQGCAGELPEARYNQCVQLQGQYNARIETMKTDGNAYLQRQVDAANKALEPLISIVVRQSTRINEIAAEMGENFKQFLKAQEEQQAVNKEIAKIRVKISDLCAEENISVAAKQLCNGVNWDGKRTDLPGLGAAQPKGTVIVPNN